MSVRKQIPYSSGMFFITFTNAHFIPLFEITNSYDLVYKWFEYLRLQGHFVNGYVLMPNHLHAILTFTPTAKSINRTVGDGKRFMAYEIVKRLETQQNLALLEKLINLVNATDKKRNKKHEVFEPSFEWKECDTDILIEQKLDYIHLNPCRTVPQLAVDPCDYKHSSAKYYINSDIESFPIDHVMQMKDVKLDK